MKEFSRRRLLKGIAALPIASVASRFAMPASAMAVAMTRVNVIVHGFGLVKVDKANPKTGVTIMLPDINLGHEHRVGGFYKTTDTGVKIDIDQRYELTNLIGAPAFPDFDRSVNAVFPAEKLNADAFKSLRRIVLPYPGALLSLHCVKRQDGAALISGADVNLLAANPAQIALTHVLVYGVQPGKRIRLVDENGAVVFTVSPDTRGNGSTGNCHFFNDPDKHVDAGHAQAAFQLFRQMTKTDGSGSLQIDFNSDLNHDLIDAHCGKTLDGGILKEDILDLVERSKGVPGANCLRPMLVPQT